MMKRILVAVDRTQHAYAVMNRAIELASLSKSELTLLSVISQNPLLKDSIRGEQEKLVAFHKDLVLRNFPEKSVKIESSQAKGTSYSYGDVKVLSRIENGEPTETICNVGDQIDADLIIIGSRGLGTIGGLVLDSVSEKIVRKASRAVMVVKDQRSEDPDWQKSHKTGHRT